jgi:Tol biopolymer transport system component/tRNA A-37 threonylcarbamoyl transferase component Bud32
VIGQTLGHYQITDKLGEGGMGAVYKARDTKLNRFVAIKALGGTGGDRKARFLQEAQAASALNHPNIVTIYDFLTHDGHDYIVMEYVAGQTLGHVTPRTGLPLEKVLSYGIQMASALTAAHEAGIAHRDIKPSNILVRDDGAIKVLDFGLAKLTEMAPPTEDEATRTAGAPQTEEGAILGTIQYMSPEQAEGRKVDARTDVFSFGAVLYEMLTGRRAFQGDSKLSTMAAILKEDPKPPSEIAPDVPREMERLVQRCLRKDRERRYQLMKEVKLALEELKEESDSGRLSTSTASGVHVMAPTPASRWPIYAGVGVLVAAAAGGMLWMRNREAPAVTKELSLRPLTQDAGYSGGTAISPDGKMVAYASDRAEPGNLDIWVQQIASGAQPIRLTRDPGRDSAPSFSPDGGQIVFSSSREGGGIYIVSAFGGDERVVMRGYSLNPAFSPDGQWIASWRDPFANKTFIVPASGGTPRQVASEFYAAQFAAWSPDGKKILFAGSREQGDLNREWWLIDATGQNATPLKVRAVISREGQGRVPFPSSWTGDHIYYSTRNLYRIGIDGNSGKLIGPPERLTQGASLEAGPSAALYSGPRGWRIAFTSYATSQSQLYRLSLLSGGKGELNKAEPLYQDGASRDTPSLSRDGSKLAYLKRAVDAFEIQVRDMASGAEKTLIRNNTGMRVRISPDGRVVAYNLTPNNEKETDIYLMPSGGGASKKACDKCGMIYGWAPDSRRIIFRSGAPMRFWTFDTESGAITEILSHPKYHVHAARYSDDMKWIAFHLAPGDGPQHIFVAPARDGGGPRESEWIPVFTQPGYNKRPWWSADGQTLYFISDSEGVDAIYSQRLDAATKRPVGSPAYVFRPEGDAARLLGGHLVGPGETEKFIVFGMSLDRANVWLAE